MVEILFPYILLFYFIDCFSYTKNSYILFVSNFGRKFSSQSPGINLSGFFPFGQSYIASSLPFILNEKGIYSSQAVGNSLDPDRMPVWKLLSYDEFEHVTTETQSVVIDKKTFLKLSSIKEAKYIAKLIIDVKKASITDRLTMVQAYLTDRADLKRVEDTKALYRPVFAFLITLTSLLFLLTFIVIPILIYSEPNDYLKVPPVIASTIFLYITILVTGSFWHKKIYPDDLQAQVTFLLLMILIPPSAIHLLDKITRDMYVEYDYLAVGAVFLPESEFKKLFREECERISKWKNDLDPDLQWFWEMKDKANQEILVNKNLSSDMVWQQPKKVDPEAVSYCPTCMVEYRSGFNKCFDCDTVLKNFI
jgi:hypothetical protein